ncbi:MAG: hypothetical protein [Bacteriophage sp.]|nr:MAG: hypothetical protein [Bacteriophage sp.]
MKFSRYYHSTEEQISFFRINEIVEVRGIITAIRDIYVRTFGYDEDGERKFAKHLSYRMLDKPFWCEDTCFHDIKKLEGKLIGE